MLLLPVEPRSITPWLKIQLSSTGHDPPHRALVVDLLPTWQRKVRVIRTVDSANDTDTQQHKQSRLLIVFVL